MPLDVDATTLGVTDSRLACDQAEIVFSDQPRYRGTNVAVEMQTPKELSRTSSIAVGFRSASGVESP